MLAAVSFLFDNLREKRSVPLTKQSDIACFKSSCGSQVENRCSRRINFVIRRKVGEKKMEKEAGRPLRGRQNNPGEGRGRSEVWQR